MLSSVVSALKESFLNQVIFSNKELAEICEPSKASLVDKFAGEANNGGFWLALGNIDGGFWQDSN